MADWRLNIRNDMARTLAERAMLERALRGVRSYGSTFTPPPNVQAAAAQARAQQQQSEEDEGDGEEETSATAAPAAEEGGERGLKLTAESGEQGSRPTYGGSYGLPFFGGTATLSGTVTPDPLRPDYGARLEYRRGY